MANSFFKFKQFIINQENCAMKVTTESCLFGAIAATYCPLQDKTMRVLDIGTGTGLLALMYAQKNTKPFIDAVEIDAAAASQAIENFAESPWEEQLKVVCTGIQEFDPAYRYDLIISNPPFYEKQLASGNILKAKAHHSTNLSLLELLSSAKRLLSPTGSCLLLMPFYREEETIKLAALQNWGPTIIINVRQTPKHQFFRSIMLFKEATGKITKEEITIKEVDGNYFPRFKDLLESYYLFL